MPRGKERRNLNCEWGEMSAQRVPLRLEIAANDTESWLDAFCFELKAGAGKVRGLGSHPFSPASVGPFRRIKLLDDDAFPRNVPD